MKSLVISHDDVRAIVRDVGLTPLMDEVIDRLTCELLAYDPNHIRTPARAGFHYQKPELGLIEWMPALRHGDAVVLKIVGYHPRNPDLHQLPTILSTLCSFDCSSGHLRVIADGTFMTAVRTGAASAVASRALANPDSRVLGLIGSGAQAVTQLHALSRVFDLDRVMVFDSNPRAADTLKERTSFLGIPIEPVDADGLEELTREADIICTATSVDIGEGPVMPDGAHKPWLHINAVGSDFPGKTELPKDLLRNALVCPDLLDQAIAEGECQLLLEDEIGPDLVTVVQDPALQAEARGRLTVFDSTGWSLEDDVALSVLHAHARRLGIGTPIQIESICGDPKDPYSFAHADPSPAARTDRAATHR